MASLIAVLSPIIVALLDYWVKNYLEDIEIKYRWNLFKNTLEKKGLISGNLKHDYERQLEELKKRGPNT